MARVFIGIGSNEGDRLALVSRAMQLLAEAQGVRVVQMATIFDTEPLGGPPQGPYLNTVVELDTTLTPQALLALLQATERALGRTPSAQRWAARPMDLDLLFYDARVVHEPGLDVPHPRLQERRFVLESLAQLAPDLRHPTLGFTIAELLAQLPVPEPAFWQQP